MHHAKLTILGAKIKNFGSQYGAWWGGDTLPTPHPLGASILAPVALDLGACGASSSNFAKTVWMSAMRAATVDPIGLKAN